MKVFLDAHVLLWAIYLPDQLTPQVRDIVNEPANTRFVSEATQWELLNKVGRGRIAFTGNSVLAVAQRILELKVDFVPILQEDTFTAASLPHHHSDPFDRMLIVQSTRLGSPILTKDSVFSKYGVATIW